MSGWRGSLAESATTLGTTLAAPREAPRSPAEDSDLVCHALVERPSEQPAHISGAGLRWWLPEQRLEAQRSCQGSGPASRCRWLCRPLLRGSASVLSHTRTVATALSWKRRGRSAQRPPPEAGMRRRGVGPPRGIVAGAPTALRPRARTARAPAKEARATSPHPEPLEPSPGGPIPRRLLPAGPSSVDGPVPAPGSSSRAPGGPTPRRLLPAGPSSVDGPDTDAKRHCCCAG